jgi:hypothetical protein
VVELKTPPAKVRRRIFEGHAEGLPISSEWLHRASQDDRVRPGHIENAARVARLLQPGTEQECEATLSRVIDGALAAEGQCKPSKTAKCDACAYDPSLVNADQDLESIVSGFDRCRVGTLCLYGPPGTGKSAYVAYLAERLGVPLLLRRASDIMSHFWGATEKNIAAMFRQAESEKALLFVDEADSFFKDREQVTYSWERSEVNELLTHMETFEGMFVCATNLMEGMDPAVFRRFSLKVRLDPLRPDQRWKMLAATLRGLGVTVPRGAGAKAVRRALERLDQLTPGDFAAVARRIRLTQPELSTQVVVEALADECQYKPGADVRAIGFAR